MGLGPEPYQPPVPGGPSAPVPGASSDGTGKPKAPAPPHIESHVPKEQTGEKAFRWLTYGFELLRGILVVVIVAILFNLFVGTVFRISGESMYPSFEDGQFILVDRLSHLIRTPHRGDVVIVQFPADPEKRKFIKRVVALPGETIEIKEAVVLVNDKPLSEPYIPAFVETTPDIPKQTIRDDEVFIMGDNRPNSNDSRFFGPLPLRRMIGTSRAILSGKAYGFIAQPAF